MALGHRWATVKFLRAHYKPHIDDITTRDPPGGLPLKRRVARSIRSILFRLYQHLMTRIHRINQRLLIDAFRAACRGSDEVFALKVPVLPHDLTQRDRELVIEAVALSRARERKMRLRRLRRVHKGIACAGGCGTPYGGRRHDHDFFGGGGIQGGWFCPSNGSCQVTPTGEHYCGMCDQERRAPVATADP